MFIPYDTETSDRWDFKAPWNDPSQPHLVQLGYHVIDRNFNILKTVDVVVNSALLKGWNGIAEGAAAVHGIDEDRMEREGLHPEVVAQTLYDDFKRGEITIAHNNGFDMQVLNLFMFRCGFAPNLFEGKHNLCTMKPLTNILKIANKNGRAGYKWPTLTEAYCNLVDSKGFEGAHDALTDVNACWDIFKAAWNARIVQDQSWTVAREFYNVHRS